MKRAKPAGAAVASATMLASDFRQIQILPVRGVVHGDVELMTIPKERHQGIVAGFRDVPGGQGLRVAARGVESEKPQALKLMDKAPGAHDVGIALGVTAHRGASVIDDLRNVRPLSVWLRCAE